LQVVEQPQLAAPRVDDPLAVGAGLACVPDLVIGVPSQVAAVREAARSVSRDLGWKVESMDVLNTRFGVYK